MSWMLVGQIVLLSGWGAFLVAFVKSVPGGRR